MAAARSFVYRIAFRIAVGVALLLGGAGPALGQPTALQAALADARALADSAAAHVPGVSLAISVGGRTMLAEGRGYADLEARAPATPQTRYRVGSVSKPMTAVAVAHLVDRGELDPDLPVQAYVPGFPEKRAPVTTRALGAHLAGIRHYRGQEFLSQTRYETVTDGLSIFAADTLLHAPGTAYRYTSYGWNLISAVVEGAAGEPFLAFMAREVFAPLGMSRTVPDRVDRVVVGRARPYVQAWSPDGPVLANAPHVDNSYKWAGGGFLSTVEDMVQLGEGAVLGGAVGAAGRALMLTEQATAAGEGVGYGFGWRLGEDADGRGVVFHSGGSVGGTSLLHVTPEARVVVAAATNLSNADLGWVAEVARRVAAATAE